MLDVSDRPKFEFSRKQVFPLTSFVAVRRWITAFASEEKDKNPDWEHVEDAGDVEEAEHSVDEARALMEAGSLGPLDFFAFVFGFDLMVQQFLEVVIQLRFEVELAELHDHLQCNKMDNAVLDRVLVSQKPNAHDGCAESLEALDQAEYE